MPGRSAVPSPGRTRSHQLRVGFRRSLRWTPTKRRACTRMCARRYEVSQRCQTSNRIPVFGSSTSSSRSIASGIVVRKEKSSLIEECIGSTASVTPTSAAAHATRCSPQTAILRAARSPYRPTGPETQMQQTGENSANLRTSRQIVATPLLGVRRALTQHTRDGRSPGQDRREGRVAEDGSEAAGAKLLKRRFVVGELLAPVTDPSRSDSDALCPRLTHDDEILGKRQTGRHPFADREQRVVRHLLASGGLSSEWHSPRSRA